MFESVFRLFGYYPPEEGYRRIQSALNPANHSSDQVQQDAQGLNQDPNQPQQQNQVPVQTQAGQAQTIVTQDSTQPPLIQEQPFSPSRVEVIADFKRYFIDPRNHVLDEPGKAIIYSIVIKISSVIIAFIFPCLGWLMIGFSLALIDRIIILNFREFSTSTVETIFDYCRQSVQMLLGTGREGPLQQT